MAGENTLNYTEQGGAITHIGGSLQIDSGGKILPSTGTQPAITALTDSSGGTANNTVQAIGGSFSQSEIANNFADVAGKINELIAIIKAAGLAS